MSLAEAVLDIHCACQERQPSEFGAPFCLLVGAGISHPSVPVAEEMVREFKRVAAERGRNTEPKSSAPIDVYSHWFEAAYPSRAQRRAYLQNKAGGCRLSQANLRLAHLVGGGCVGRMVVTPNFDDMLSRAMRLFAIEHVICDHPATFGRADLERREPQILHVHGSYWYYDCCNLREEIEARASAGHDGSHSAAMKLNDVFASRSPLVVGYSGWEGDVITSAIERRLRTELPYPIYWFCHKRSDAESVPAAIREHDDVRLVLPKLVLSEGQDVSGGDGGGRGSGAKSLAQGESATDGARIEARTVFEAFIKKFGVEMPRLMSDPLGVVLKDLRDSLPAEDSANNGSAVYFFGKVIEDLSRARDFLRTEDQDETSDDGLSSVEAVLRRIREMVMQVEYHQALEQATALDLDRLTQEQQLELLDAAELIADGLDDDSAEELLAYDILGQAADRVMARGGASLQVMRRAAAALVSRGYVLGQLHRNEEEMAAYDEVVSRFGESKELSLQDPVARALVNKGYALGKLERNEEEIAAYDEVVSRFGDSKELALQKQVGRALFNKGYVMQSDGGEEAIPAYDEVVSRFGDSKEVALQELAGRALVNRGTALRKLDRIEEAIPTYDEVVSRFGESKELSLQEPVARALVNKGYALGKLDRNEEEIAAYDEVVSRFGDSKDVALQEPVAQALFNKGCILGQLHRSEEELAAYDEVVSRFGESKELSLQEVVARALVNRGVAETRVNGLDAGRGSFSQAIKVFEGADLTESNSLEFLTALVGMGEYERAKEFLRDFEHDGEREYGSDDIASWTEDMETLSTAGNGDDELAAAVSSAIESLRETLGLDSG